MDSRFFYTLWIKLFVHFYFLIIFSYFFLGQKESLFSSGNTVSHSDHDASTVGMFICQEYSVHFAVNSTVIGLGAHVVGTISRTPPGDNGSGQGPECGADQYGLPVLSWWDVSDVTHNPGLCGFHPFRQPRIFSISPGLICFFQGLICFFIF